MRGSFECIYVEYTIFAHLGFSSMYAHGKHDPTDYHLMNNSFVPGSAMGALYTIFHLSHWHGRTRHSEGRWGLSKIAQLVGVRGGTGTEL